MTTTRSSETPEGGDASKSAAVAAAAMGAVLTIGAFALYGSRIALSVGFGAAVAVVNLVTMRAIIRALMKPPPEADVSEDVDGPGDAEAKLEAEAEAKVDHVAAGKRGGVAWGVFAVLKILVLFGGIWFLLTRGLVDPISLAVGYGVLPIGIATSTLWSSMAPRSRRTK